MRRGFGATMFSTSGLEGVKDDFTDDYLLGIPADEEARNPNLTD